ncbi:MAG: O-methyltransferase [Terriglobales bacterium]
MITAPEVEQYLHRLLPARSAVLAAMEAEAGRRDIPIVGPVVARLLHQLAVLARAQRVFELGSAIGYSTLWWADAVGEGGEVFYTDSSAANAREAAGYFERAGLAGRIHILQGDALEQLAATPGSFDVIFCDLNKPQYPEALRLSLPRLRPGGLFVADNVLWRGEVCTPAGAAATAEARAIAELNRALYANPRLETVILPLRDGVAVARLLPE